MGEKGFAKAQKKAALASSKKKRKKPNPKSSASGANKKGKSEAAVDAVDVYNKTKNAYTQTKKKKARKLAELPDFWMDMDKVTFPWDKLEIEEHVDSKQPDDETFCTGVGV